MLSFIWSVWIAVLLVVIFYFLVVIDKRIKTIYMDTKCTKYTIESYVRKTTRNKE